MFNFDRGLSRFTWSHIVYFLLLILLSEVTVILCIVFYSVHWTQMHNYSASVYCMHVWSFRSGRGHAHTVNSIYPYDRPMTQSRHSNDSLLSCLVCFIIENCSPFITRLPHSLLETANLFHGHLLSRNGQLITVKMWRSVGFYHESRAYILFGVSSIHPKMARYISIWNLFLYDSDKDMFRFGSNHFNAGNRHRRTQYSVCTTLKKLKREKKTDNHRTYIQ